MKKPVSYFDLNKQNRNGILFLIIILCLIQAGIVWYTPSVVKTETTLEQKMYVQALQKELDALEEDKVELKLKEFDPNDLSKKDWMNLGFSEKQAKTILKYKRSLHQFSNLDQIKKCYVISDKKFTELEPYIKFNQNLYQASTTHYDAKKETVKKYSSKPLNLKPFNPNMLNQKGWMRLGFSEKQANVILKYKKSLGGQFNTKEDIKRCFVISSEKYDQLAPFLIFEDKKQVENKIDKTNGYDVKSLVLKGLTSKEAYRVVNYQKALGGFCDWNQLKEIHLSEEKIKVLKETIKLDSSVEKLNINTEELYTLKKHPYITPNFISFLKESRAKGVLFSSFQELQNHYKIEELHKLLEQYLLY